MYDDLPGITGRADRGEEEFRKLRASRTRNIFFALAVVVIFIIMSLVRGKGVTPVSVSIKDGDLILTGPDGSETVSFSEIESIEFFESPDYGNASGGSEKAGFRCGTWESPDLGTYTAYLNTGIKGCILIKGTKGAWALSVESNETTKIFAETLTKAWNDMK